MSETEDKTQLDKTADPAVKDETVKADVSVDDLTSQLGTLAIEKKIVKLRSDTEQSALCAYPKPKDEIKEVVETKVEIDGQSDTDIIGDIIEAITQKADTRTDIILLKEKEVVQWLFGDLSFLPPIEKKNKTQDTKKYKVLEDEWGRAILKKKRPDLELKGQWTNRFGEHLIEELYKLLGQNIAKPANKDGHEPDLETDDYIIEVKTETYWTEGTAGEKILGCPFKYASVPRLYGKPMKIICLGGAEKAGVEQYGILNGTSTSANANTNDRQPPEKKKFLEFYKEMQIEYVSATSVLKALL
jgi:hypothetical protein